MVNGTEIKGEPTNYSEQLLWKNNYPYAIYTYQSQLLGGLPPLVGGYY
jgi:hypothetical protein